MKGIFSTENANNVELTLKLTMTSVQLEGSSQHGGMMSAPGAVQRIPDTDDAWDERRLGADERYVGVAPIGGGTSNAPHAHAMSHPSCGWIAWNGGECPVPLNTRVEIRCRDGDCWADEQAGSMYWEHRNDIGDIMSYRVVPTILFYEVNDPNSFTATDYNVSNGARKFVSERAMGRYIDMYRGKAEHIEEDFSRLDCVLLTVEERDELLRIARSPAITYDDYALVSNDRDALRAEVERLNVQLAGCGVAAMGNTREALAQAAKPADYGYSASYGDVLRAVEREVTLREQAEQLGQAVGLLTTLHPTMEMDTADPVGMAQRVVQYVNEQLRKGREDGQNHGDVAGRNRDCGSVDAGVRPGDCVGLATLADTLDPRLGIPQPEGEPVAPMSAKAWRWLA